MTVKIVVKVTDHTNTSVRNQVPNTSLIVTTEQIAQVEQNLLLNVHELNGIVASVL